MADKEPFESLTGIAQQTADQITQQTKVAMENYLNWFQNAMSASQWGNVDLWVRQRRRTDKSSLR